MAGRRRAAAFALVLTTLALLVARGSAPRRTDLLDAPFVQLADADADAQEDGSDAVSEGEGSNVRFLPYLPRKLSKGTKKKMATMDRMVLGWNAKKDPAEFARDYSSDTDRVAGEAAQDAVADMERQQHEEVRYAGQKWPSGLPHHFGRPNLALAKMEEGANGAQHGDLSESASLARMEEEANEARETAIQASKRAGGDPRV
ncbi:hypothetical protein T484DRAFT_1832894 [Baffinella frigidus]|nr:hypothetical protein T484DRAFT_1832894 [Cryptophyta sp. CCMP2293]